MVLMSTHKQTIFWYIDGHCYTVPHIVNTYIIKRNYSLCPKHTSESPRWDGFGVCLEHILRGYLYIVVNTCIINVIMAYALSTHQNRLSETALVCIWNILSIDISHTKCFIAPHALTEIITYWGDSGECRKRDKPWLSVTCMSNRSRSKGNHPYRLNNPEKICLSPFGTKSKNVQDSWPINPTS